MQLNRNDQVTLRLSREEKMGAGAAALGLQTNQGWHRQVLHLQKGVPGTHARGQGEDDTWISVPG